MISYTKKGSERGPFFATGMRKGMGKLDFWYLKGSHYQRDVESHLVLGVFSVCVWTS